MGFFTPSLLFQGLCILTNHLSSYPIAHFTTPLDIEEIPSLTQSAYIQNLHDAPSTQLAIDIVKKDLKDIESSTSFIRVQKSHDSGGEKPWKNVQEENRVLSWKRILSGFRQFAVF